MAKYMNPTKVITGPNTTFSYLNCWDPKAIQGGTPKFSVSLIIPKSDVKTIEKIKAAIQAAYEEGQSKLKEAITNILKHFDSHVNQDNSLKSIIKQSENLLKNLNMQ